MNCENLIEKEVCVEAKIKVRPKAEAGRVQVVCRGEPKFVDRSCMSSADTFDINQTLCFKIPVTFSARAMAEATGIGCMRQCEDRCYPDPCDFEDDE